MWAVMLAPLSVQWHLILKNKARISHHGRLASTKVAQALLTFKFVASKKQRLKFTRENPESKSNKGELRRKPCNFCCILFDFREKSVTSSLTNIFSYCNDVYKFVVIYVAAIQ